MWDQLRPQEVLNLAFKPSPKVLSPIYIGFDNVYLLQIILKSGEMLQEFIIYDIAIIVSTLSISYHALYNIFTTHPKHFFSQIVMFTDSSIRITMFTHLPYPQGSGLV